MLKQISMALFALSIFLVVPSEAEAKRFGGGFSLGKSFNTPTRKATDVAPVRPQATPSATQRPGMGGLMGGLLAGGLLGALLFGGAFEGVQLMDILLIGLVGFMIYRLFFASRTQPSYSGYSSQDAAVGAQQGSLFQARDAGFDGGAGSTSQDMSGIEEPEIKIPDWFQKESFLAGATHHFKALQKAWDQQDWAEIESYASPELVAQLKTNRSVLPDNQNTDVTSVRVELVNFIEEDSEAILSLNFHGWIRENGAPDTTEFSEIWHLSRDPSKPESGWTLVGIQQD